MKWPLGAGMGIDLDPDAIATAKKNAEIRGVAQRIQFLQARLSAEPMAIAPDALAKVDILTAIFMLHEFGGRGGPALISTLIRSLRMQFPGRKLLMVEGTRADPFELGRVAAADLRPTGLLVPSPIIATGTPPHPRRMEEDHRGQRRATGRADPRVPAHTVLGRSVRYCFIILPPNDNAYR